jgi:Holliday junction resolvase RusA-like endonuclease
MKIIINYKFTSINQYINECRTNYHIANKTKQKETMLSAIAFTKIPKITKYPIEIKFKWHMKSKTADLDGRIPKNIIDGLVRSKRIPDDNVKYIQRIIHEYVGDTKDYVEVEIEEMK